MNNSGQTFCSEMNDVETQFKQWESKQIKEDARRFEHIIRESRIKLGLEVSHV